MDKIIQRINALAKKAREEGLSEEEVVERDKLRQMYINAFKSNLKSTLENTYVVDEDGNKRHIKDVNKDKAEEK